MLGLPHDRVIVADSDPGWPVRFGEEERALRGVVGSIALDIQHVGSTSVAGLAAKPVLDIVIAVATFEAGKACVGPI